MAEPTIPNKSNKRKLDPDRFSPLNYVVQEGGVFCKLCQTLFRNKKNYFRHYNKHHAFGITKEEPKKSTSTNCVSEVGGIFCTICQSVLKNKRNFERHYKRHETDTIVYTCVACHKDIPCYNSFRNHCYSHHVLKPRLQCDICQKYFSKVTALNKHVKNFHRLLYTCPAPCNESFKTIEELKLHTARQHTNKQHDCQICHMPLKKQEACEEHIDAHIEYQYSCPICEENIHDQTAAKHIQKHFKNEVLELNGNYNIEMAAEPGKIIVIACSFCNTSYKDKDEFEAHFQSKHDSKIIYSCSLCSKEFDVYKLLANHWYNHSTKDRFKCDICEKTFSRLNLLVLHTETKHNTVATDIEKPFQCMQCEQSFCESKTLKAHLYDVHGSPYQICPYQSCGKMFDSPAALIFHQIDHKDDAENRCCKCGLPFKGLTSCLRHIRIHKKVKFTCPVCSKKFKEKHNIFKHVKQHYQTVFYTCQHCGKMYTLQSRLLEHSKIHNRELLICSYCNKKFPTKKRLHDHVNTHTGVMPYKCMVCEKMFAAEPNWRKHLKIKHEITSVSKSAVLEATFDFRINANSDTKTEDVVKSMFDITREETMISMNGDTMDRNMDAKPSVNNIKAIHKVDMSKTSTCDINSNENIANDNVDSVCHDDMDFDLDFNLKHILYGNIYCETGTSSQDTVISLDEFETTALPREYGPDFTSNSSVNSYEYSTEVINLSEMSLPHIDPSLTDTKQYTSL